MNTIFFRMKTILVISGALTFSMIHAAFAPEAALQSTFGTSTSDPLMLLIVRNWGVLIALVGLMLIHAAFNEQARPLALGIAGASKLAFVSLVLSHGTDFLAGQAALAVVIDTLMVLIFASYLLTYRQSSGAVKDPVPAP